MTIKLIFGQTRYDQNTMWTEIKTIDIEVPDTLSQKFDNFEWHLLGAEMEKQNDD